MTVWKEPADMATTEELGVGPAFPASGVIDGVTLKAGNRVLVKDQLTPTENGYYKVVAGVPPTLTVTGETIEAEDVIRVNQGDRNAYTAWALIDATYRVFVRHDVKHYSLKSIDALKHLWQVLPDATATVACYAERGDKGGGDFTFIGVPESARVVNATPESRLIKTVADVDGVVTITTSTPHDLGNPNNITTTYISGVAGLANKAYSVRVVNTDTLTINANAPISGASFAAGAQIQYVRLVTAGPHGRATGQRISVSGVVALSGAVDIYKVIDLSGVIDDTTLSIPIATTGGTYMPGSHAVTGDDGLTVPATDPTGTFGGLWQRLRTDHFDVRWFGAKPNWDGTMPSNNGTANLAAFEAALATMAAGGRPSGKLVADGHFYLCDTLVLTQTVVLEGTGQNDAERSNTSRCSPGTWLVFPKKVTGIRIRGGSGLDNPTKTYGNPFPPSGEKTVLRNLTVYCKDAYTPLEAKECRDEEECLPEGSCIHGIHASTVVRLENVTVEHFAHDGIHIIGAVCGKPVLDGDGKPVRVYDGNADGSYIENCTAGNCGHDGFHFQGGDANACVITGCSGVGNGHAGFYDATFGNTYIGCHSAYNEGPNYITKELVNASVFINCWSEEGGKKRNEFHGQVTIISGKIGGNPDYMTPDSSAFILEHGVATRAPLVYKNLAGAKSIGCSLGDMGQTVQGPGNEMIAFQWATLKSADDQNIDDFTSLRYLDEPNVPPGSRGHGWWALAHNNSFYRHMIRFPTTQTFARLPAPWFVNGIFLGRDDIGPPKVSFTAAPNLPNTQDNGEPLTYERGDVVWKSDPSPGEPIGQVCIASGTLTSTPLVGVETADPVNLGDTTAKLNKVDGLASGQYITIGGGTDVYTIVKVALTKSMIGITPGAFVGVPVGAAIAFSPATFSTFGTVDSPSTSYAVDTLLALADRADRYVTVTATGKTMTLPASPVDGQTHSIKSQAGTPTRAGVTTTVETQDSLKIDGQDSVTLAPGELGTFRYSVATGEWETR